MSALPTTRSTTLSTAPPPGPPPRKGVVQSLKYYAGFALDPIGFVADRFERYGDIYYAPSSDGGLFVLKHPDHLREVLTTRASSFTKEHTAFAQLSRVLGEGLLTSDGDTWTRQRRMVQPAFAPARMASYARVMVEESLRTAAAWAQQPGERDIGQEMMTLTLRIVSAALFGHDVPDADIAVVARAMHHFQRSLSTPDFLPSWVPNPSRRRLERSLAALDDIIHRLIEERMALLDSEHAGGTGAGAASKRSDLLELLVTAVDVEGRGGKLTIKEVRDQLVTLFLAGHETTSHAMTWTFACLAQNPAAERALHAELDDVLGDRAPVLADLERLPYTEQVVSEAMRLYPPVYLIARRAREDTEVGGFSVPKGAEVIIWVYYTHRDPRFFPEPEAFRPERFEKERAAALPKLAYLPFGAGPRACIGRTFAMMEARLILATLAQRQRLTLARGQSLAAVPRITLTPKRGMRMKTASRR
jgi:cytochrome P450